MPDGSPGVRIHRPFFPASCTLPLSPVLFLLNAQDCIQFSQVCGHIIMTRKENSDYRASVGRRQSQQCLCPRKHTEHALAEVRSVLLEQKSTQTNLLGSGKTLIHFCFFFRHSCVLREPVLNHCKRLCCKLEYAVSRNNSTVCLRDSLNSQSILFFLKNIYVFT